MITIRQANVNDIGDIVETHIECFPDSYSSSIGKNLLSKYYLNYLINYPDLFLIALDNEKVVGFVMGYLCGTKNLANNFVKTHLFSLLVRSIARLLVFDKRVWRKIIRKKNDVLFVDEQFSLIDDSLKGDLLSICLLDKYRGNDVASSLEKMFCERVKVLGRCYCTLSMQATNERAKRFYEKCGYSIYKKTSEGIYYFKEL